MRRVPLLSSAARMPRGIQRIQAQTDTPSMIRAIQAAQQQHNSATTTTLATLESALNDHALKLAALGMGGGGSSEAPVDATYTTAFASYFRRGDTAAEASLRSANSEGDRHHIRSSMTEGDASSGGYLAPAEWDRKISKALLATSPMRQIATVVTTSVQAYSTLWSNNQWGTGWVGETASRPTTTTPTLAPINFAAGEIYANPAASQRMLDDGLIDVEQWLATELDSVFTTQEGIAFIGGDSVNKPAGLLTYVPGGANDGALYATNPKLGHPGGNLDVAASGTAGGITVDALIDFAYGLGAGYRQNATWLMNSGTAAYLSKMKDGQGNLIWRESLIVGQPSTLLGRPVTLDENMPSVAAGSLAIAFGDFRKGYLVNDRMGVRILRDPYTNKPYVTFYATKRVGGGLLDPKAIRLLKIAAA